MVSPIYYYRDTDGREINLILEANGTLYPIELKKTGSPGKDSIKHFGVLQNSGKIVGEGVVICMYGDVVPIDRNNWGVPVWLV